MAIYDIMQFVKPDICTYCLGAASSMGALLLAAGAKDKRFAMENSRVMIHQPLIGGHGITGQATDIEIHAKEMSKTKEKLNKILAVHTGQDLKVVEEATDRDNYMSADEAKKFGLIDKVIKRSPHGKKN